MFHLAKLLQPCSWGLNWSWYSPGRRHCWHLRLMVNEIYIFIYTHTSRGHKERLPGDRQLLALHESKGEKSSCFCMGVKSKYAFSKCILACWWAADNMQRGGKGSLGSLQHAVHKTKQTSKPQPGEEGGGRRPCATARQCHRNVGKPTHSERVSAGISALVVRITAVPRAQLHSARRRGLFLGQIIEH